MGRRLRAMEVAADGDCLFTSVAAAMEHHKRPLALDPRNLRRAVAASVLRGDISIPYNTAVAFCGSRGELCQAQGSEAAWALPALFADREGLHDNMLDRELYWGEQYALCTLAKLLRANVHVVVRVDGRDTVSSNRVKHKRRSIYLLLEGQHYSPLV